MENKVAKYLLYAIGEIILVVIGILIALQINNNNELRKIRVNEIKYLTNISNDLEKNIEELDKYIIKRDAQIISATIILEHYDGKPIESLVEFNNHTINIYAWRKFFQNNNTFQELVNSGNLSLISNNEIKNKLLDLEMLYKVTKDEEAHFRYDSELLLYEPYFKSVDAHPLVTNFTYQVTNGKAGKDVPIPRKEIDKILNDISQKNGFVMAAYLFNTLKLQFLSMKDLCQEIIVMIDKEIE